MVAKVEVNPVDMTHEVLVSEFVKLKAEVKKMQKQMKKLLKDSVPDEPQKEKKVSGFAKPMKMSSVLCEFLNVDKETMMARTDVTKFINAYVKEHNLQNPENKRSPEPIRMTKNKIETQNKSDTQKTN